MLLLIFFGAVSLVAGILFLFFPKKLGQMNDSLKKASDNPVAHIDEHLLRLHAGIGVSCILLSLTCFFLVYWIFKKKLYVNWQFLNPNYKPIIWMIKNA